MFPPYAIRVHPVTEQVVGCVGQFKPRSLRCVRERVSGPASRPDGSAAIDVQHRACDVGRLQEVAAAPLLGGGEEGVPWCACTDPLGNDSVSSVSGGRSNTPPKEVSAQQQSAFSCPPPSTPAPGLDGGVLDTLGHAPKKLCCSNVAKIGIFLEEGAGGRKEAERALD